MFTLQEFRSDNPGALKGVRVVDLSRLVAGNTLTMALADLGAEVIKVEPPRGDSLREWRVHGISTAWKAYSRNKRSICLDLRQPAGVEVLQKLLASAHVFVENFRPGTLGKMGLAPTDLLALHPRLIIARISGWGQSGPYADRPGFGTLVEGMSGFAAMNGFADREPVLPPIYLADMTAGLYGAIGVLAALRAVENGSGSGQVIDVSLLDSVFSILGPQAANFRLTGKVKPRTGSCSTNSAPRNIYKTSDGHWVSLSASTQVMTKTLFRAIGRPELISDPRFLNNEARVRNVVELNRILAGHIEAMTRDECLTHFQRAGVTIAPVYDMREIEADPHFIQREIVVELPDDEMGTVPVHSICPRLSNTPGVFRNSAPRLGQDSETILEELGFSVSGIESLKEKGVISRVDSEYPPVDAE
ncbi:CaiB/BaiF CoA transferase family protein [Terracidiphilus gabretensis]|uniref:CaiB/BaiF CoA transferase family protein n=1 Tax=Terracidiphilus gabretensis TaxID=1577687 RepID=UPI00071B2E65|nr:CoA transferase [Terracidiphilus gabretensis]